MSEPAANDRIQTLLSQLPDDPGVYQYFDEKGSLLYIGKAKCLKKRVKSYFVSSKGHSYRIATMVAKIRDIRYTIVHSEAEALTLENNLIKEHQPRYNINLKDGKTFPYICIKNEPFPRVFPTRTKIADASEYFGPFTSVRTMNAILDLVRRNYKFRTCNLSLTQQNILSNKFRICLEFQIGNCFGPCENLFTESRYEQNIQAVRKILKGNLRELIEQLEEEMYKKAEAYAFEEAETLRKQLEDLKNYKRRNTVVSESISNVEVLAVDRMNDLSIVSHFKVVNGAIISTHVWETRVKNNESDEELLAAVLDRLIADDPELGTEILCNRPFIPSDEETNIEIRVPQRGDKAKLIELALKNCTVLLEEKVWKQNQKRANPEEEILVQMQKDLHLTTLPRHIECFDNSNIQGEHPVASLVVFKNGKASKKDYRHFKIKTVEGPNDFASMEEIVHRRYRRLLEENLPLPDLIIVDGGKGQLSSAAEVLSQLGINTRIPILGIAKRLEEIYVVNDPFPLLLDKRSTTLRLIQQLRNEAHRFAITFHRDLRSKNTFVTQLTSIPGIGQTIARKLLTHFKSVQKIKKASLEELTAQIGPSKANLVYSAFHAK